MEAIRLKARVGDDGLLKLELPAGISNRELDIIVVIQPIKMNCLMKWVTLLAISMRFMVHSRMIPLKLVNNHP